MLLATVAGAEVIQRKAGADEKAEARKAAQIEELARWPGEAHSAWRRLKADDRTLVLWQMAATYGDAFADQFLEEVKKKSKSPAVNHYFGRGMGPRPGRLRASGFRLAQRSSTHEWWVHPSGSTLVRDVSPASPTAEVAGQVPPSNARLQIEGTESWIDPDADREAMFGPVVASREGGDLGFGTGYVQRYQDGTLESFVDGNEGSYLLRPAPGGGYLVYGRDGKLKNGIYHVEPQDIP